jgi:hypothetical protein
VAGCCEHGNEHADSVKGGLFFKLKGYQISRKGLLWCGESINFTTADDCNKNTAISVQKSRKDTSHNRVAWRHESLFRIRESTWGSHGTVRHLADPRTNSGSQLDALHSRYPILNNELTVRWERGKEHLVRCLPLGLEHSGRASHNVREAKWRRISAEFVPRY